MMDTFCHQQLFVWVSTIRIIRLPREDAVIADEIVIIEEVEVLGRRFSGHHFRHVVSSSLATQSTVSITNIDAPRG